MSSLTYRWARRIAIAIVGGTVLAVGIAMIVLPGPAIVVIPAGLGILSLEFEWPRAWLKTIKTKGSSVLNVIQKSRAANDASVRVVTGTSPGTTNGASRHDSP